MIIDSLRKRGAEQLTDRGPKGFRFGTNPLCCRMVKIFMRHVDSISADRRGGDGTRSYNDASCVRHSHPGKEACSHDRRALTRSLHL
jgi:hypothetical protein